MALPSLLFCLETFNLFANRCERPVCVLLLAEAVGIGTVGSVDRLLQGGRKISIETLVLWPRLRDQIGGNIPCLLDRKLRVEVVGAMRHIEVDEVGRGDEARHAGAVIETVGTRDRWHDVAEIDHWKTAVHSQTLGAMA